jgi:non-specific serine/threonine protein kinase
LWYLRGRALMALQQYADATSVLQAASTAAQAWGDRLNGRRIYVELGKLHLRLGKRLEAQEHFEQARALIEQLAAKLPFGKSRDLFSTQAIRDLPQNTLISPQKAAQRTFNGLTQREREVAALLAQGKSNRTIADALTLSERTIEKHVENIMAKLDFSSRAQIAVWAAGKKLHGTSQ